MKRLISITISLCLVICSVCPVFAATNSVNAFVDYFNTSNQVSAYTFANTVMSALASTVAQIINLNNNFQNWATLDHNGNAVTTTRTFQDIAEYINMISAQLNVSTISGTYTVKELLEMFNVSNTSIDSYTQANNALLSGIHTNTATSNTNEDKLIKALCNDNNSYTTLPLLNTAMMKNSHRYLGSVFQSSGKYYQAYNLPFVSVQGQNGYIDDYQYLWKDGTPLGNIALMLLNLNWLNSDIFAYAGDNFYEDYDSQLSVWDSQGSSLQQMLYTPTSVVNGLYKYFAYTQRDVARLAYVFANDEELEARELAQDNQQQVVDDFIDPDGIGSVSSTDLGDMATISNQIKDNFDTGISATNIFNVFDNNHYNWFTRATQNQLDTVQTRSEYPTPLLDEYYNEIYSLFGDEER